MSSPDIAERTPAGRLSGSASALESAWSGWARLAEIVREFHPDVVVLTPRKPVRMRQAMQLDFGRGTLVVCATGVALARRWLRGARVAVVDDIVNVGSTIANALACVQEAGASEVRAFAITTRTNGKVLDGLRVTYASDAALGALEQREFGRRVPEALQRLAKPYDVDYPVLRCSLRAPLRRFDDLFAVLCSLHGQERIYDLSTPVGAAAGVRRLTLDFGAGAVNRKVRIYMDERTGRCNVMPIAVGPVLAREPDPSWSAMPRAVWDAVLGSVDCSAGATPEQALELVVQARLRLFCDSLDYGQRFVDAHEEWLTLDLCEPFELDDAEMILGPSVRATTIPLDASPQPAQPDSPAPRPVASPFLGAARANGFVEELRRSVVAEPEPAFLQLFELLAEWNGVRDVDLYRFDWPYTRDEVRANPYLRLTIGPTGTDLMLLIAELCRLPFAAARRHVARLLDRYIDAGGVVPTLVVYEEQVYRVYRRGEGPLRDSASQRRLYAWRVSRRPLSLTRASKLFTILDFASEEEDKVMGVVARQRGNVLGYQPALFDDGGGALEYWAATGQVREVR